MGTVARAKAHVDTKRRGDGSASVGDSRADVDGSGLCRSGDRSEARIRLGPIQSAQVKGLEGTRTDAPGACRLSDGMEGENSVREGWRLRIPELPAKGKKPLSASVMVQKYLRPAAITAGVICADGRDASAFTTFVIRLRRH